MHAYSYASCLKVLAGAEFVGIWDDDAKRGRAMAKQFEAPFVADQRKFLEAVDGVIICSENVKHRALVETAAAAGKWILCEKPLAPTVEDARAMVQAAKAAGVGLGTAFPCRFVPALMDAQAQLQAGEYGEIYAASCTNHGQSPGGWFADPALSGGGATMDHSVHVVDALRWMLGREFTNVYCEMGNQMHQADYEPDDLGSLHLEMEGGVQVSHLASWSRAKTFPTWGDVTMEIIGSKGVLMIDAFRQKLDVYSDAAKKLEWAFYGDSPDLGLTRDFVQAVDERRVPAASGEDGLRATEVTVAAHASARAGKRVAIKAGKAAR